MATSTSGKSQSGKLFQYSISNMKSAVDAVRGGMSLFRASAIFKVPRTTLRSKVAGISSISSRHMGPEASIGKEIEESLVDWIKQCACSGFPISKDGLLDSVKKIIEVRGLKTPFINNRPSRSWYLSFMKRHPELKRKHSKYVNKAKASITENEIRFWFKEVSTLLGSENLEILKDPSRVWNCDETSFFLTSKGELVLAVKGKHIYEKSKNSEKEIITTLFTVSASGEYAPPLTVYKYKRLNEDMVNHAPSKWSIGKTAKGWITGEAFYEYIGNVFIPHLKDNNICLPVILFLDGHRIHLTKHLSQLCRENGIIVVALLPNATHLLQPLDVTVFAPLKKCWMKHVKKWRIENNGEEITKFNLPSALHSLLITNNSFKSNITTGFRACGLYPFGPDFFNYNKLISQNTQFGHQSESVHQFQPQSTSIANEFFIFFGNTIYRNLLQKFKSTYESGQSWRGDIQETSLYNYWLFLKSVDSCNTQMLSKLSDELTTRKHLSELTTREHLSELRLSSERLINLEELADFECDEELTKIRASVDRLISEIQQSPKNFSENKENIGPKNEV